MPDGKRLELMVFADAVRSYVLDGPAIADPPLTTALHDGVVNVTPPLKEVGELKWIEVAKLRVAPLIEYVVEPNAPAPVKPNTMFDADCKVPVMLDAAPALRRSELLAVPDVTVPEIVRAPVGLRVTVAVEVVVLPRSMPAMAMPPAVVPPRDRALVNEIDPEAGIEIDPGVEKKTTLAPATTDETTMLLPVPLAVSWSWPLLKVAGPERVTTAELALEAMLSIKAVVLAERVIVVAALPVIWSAPEVETVPPTTTEGAEGQVMVIGPLPLAESAPDTATLNPPLGLMLMPPELADTVLLTVRSEVRVPRICTAPPPEAMRLPANVPPTVVMVIPPVEAERTPPAWKLVVVSGFGKVRATLAGLEMVAFGPIVGVKMLLNEMPPPPTESLPKTVSVVGWPISDVSVRVDKAGMLRELPVPSDTVKNVAETLEPIDNEPPPALKEMEVLDAVPAAAVIVAIALACEKMMEVKAV